MAIPNIITYGNELLAQHYIVSEPESYRGREEITVASGAGKVLRGTIMGRRTRGAAATPVVAALAANTGNATVGSVTLDAHAPAGIYQVRFVTATRFAVYNTAGVEVGRGVAGTAFNGPINFTITAGGTAMVAGEGFDITVAYAAGSQEFVPAVEANNDGSEVAACILYDHVDATSAAQRATATFRDTEVQTAMLAFAGSPSNGFKNACYAALAAAGIAFR